MKTTTAAILNQCVFNKTISNFGVITKTVRLLSDKHITFHKLDIVDYDCNDSGVHIHFKDKDYKLITISFSSSEHISITLGCGCQTTMANDGYNIQYNDIRNIIQAYEGV